MIIAIYRLGCYVPVPGIDVDAIKKFVQERRAGRLRLLQPLRRRRARQRVAIFALGIMPYITASIIMQLLTMVIPKLEALTKEGEPGQKKINQYTRYFTVVLALVEAIGFVFLFRSQGALPDLTWLAHALLIVVTLTVGTVARHVAGRADHRSAASATASRSSSSPASCRASRAALHKLFTLNPGYWVAHGVVIIGLAVIVGRHLRHGGQRRIPVQYAKRVVGRRMMGGRAPSPAQSTWPASSR